MIQFEKNEGPTRVVDADNMLYLSTRGWVLVAVLEEQFVQTLEEPVPFESLQLKHQERSYGGDRSTLTWKRQVVVPGHRYLMRELETSAMGDLQADLDRHQRLLHEARNDAELAKAERKALEGEFVLAKSKAAASEAKCLSVHDMYDRARDRGQKLEGDIAKIRNAVGELRMKEILGGGS